MIRSSFNHPTSVQRDFLLAFYQAVTVTLASTAFYAGYKIAKNPERYSFCFQSEESRKHAVAGCLLTALLILPVLSNVLHPAVMTLTAVAYTFVVVPVVAGFYGTPTLWMLQRRLRRASRVARVRLGSLFRGCYKFLLIAAVLLYNLPMIFEESLDLQMHTSEITFYALSEHAFGLGPSRSSVFLLVLYAATTVSAEITVVDSAFASVVTASYSSIALRYGLKVSHVVTVVYIILNRVKMPSSHVSRWIQEKTELKLDGLCGFYFSLLAGTLSICISTFIAFLGLLNGFPGPSLSMLFVLSLYANVFIPYKTLVRDVWRPMAKRRECLDALSRAAVVSDELGGEQCPVCLEEGPTRVTVACGHAFHSHCLVRCLEESTNCPMCRTDMLLSSEIT